jgi:hypothetical protein
MHARRELPRGETRRINTKATADVLERTDEIDKPVRRLQIPLTTIGQ